MNSYTFLVSVFSFNLIFQLLRFPQLIIENGGGAFLILFFLMMNLIGLPCLIAERAWDRKFNEDPLSTWQEIFPQFASSTWHRLAWVFWRSLRLVVLFVLLWFFLHISVASASQALSYFYLLLKPGPGTSTHLLAPEVNFHWFSAFAVSLFSFLIFLCCKKTFLAFMKKWVLPFCLGVFFLLFLKIILSVNDYQGLKILFYPDFSAVKKESLQLAIGHSLVCLFVGLGLYRGSFLKKETKDPIELLIRLIILNLLLALAVGVMSLPMIEQASEVPVGLRWLFEVLPRWLSYGDFPYYYTSLYFIALSAMSFYLSVLMIQLIGLSLGHLRRWAKWPRLCLQLAFVPLNALVIFFLRDRLYGWTGQSLFVTVDHILVNWLFPLLALVLISFVRVYLTKTEQNKVFAYQQVFFHNQIFFLIWRSLVFIAVPLLILGAWGLSLT